MCLLCCPLRLLAAEIPTAPILTGAVLLTVSMAAVLLLLLFRLKKNKALFQAKLNEARQSGRQRERSYRQIFDSADDGILAVDAEGKVERINPVAARMTGVDRQTVIGKPYTDFLHIVDADNETPIETSFFCTRQTDVNARPVNHTDLISSDGKHRYHIEVRSAPIYDEANHAAGVILIFRDVTEEYAHRLSAQVNLTSWDVVAEIAHICRFSFDPLTFRIEGSRGLSDLWPIKDGVLMRAVRWVYTDDFPMFRKNCDEIFSGARSRIVFSFRVQNAGKMRHFRLFLSRNTETEGRVIGLIQETTELVVARTVQSSIEKLWALCIEASPLLMFVKSADNDFRYQQCNKKFAMLSGLTPEQVIGRTDYDIYGRKEDVSHFRDNDIGVMRSGQTYDVYEDVQGADGAIHHFHTIKIPAHDPNGKPILIGMSVDETENHQRRMDLQNMLAQWEVATNVARVAAFRLNTVTLAVSGSRQLEEFIPIKEGKAPRIRDFILPDDQKNVYDTYHELADGKREKAVLRYRVKKADGIHSYRGFLGRNPESEDELTGFVQDITPFVVAERQKQALLTLWQRVVDVLPVMVFIKSIDNGFRYLQCNKPAAAFFGKKEADIIGKTDLEICPPGSKLPVFWGQTDAAVVETGSPITITGNGMDAQGLIRKLVTTKIPLKDVNNHDVIVGIVQDITETEELSDVRRLIADAFELLFVSEDLNASVQTLLKRICAFADFTRAFVCCVDEAADEVRFFAAHWPDGTSRLIDGDSFTIKNVRETLWYRKLADTNQSESVDYDFTDAGSLEEAKLYVPILTSNRDVIDIRGVHMNNIVSNGKPWGCIGFVTEGHPVKNRTKSESVLLDMISHVIELAVNKQILHRHLESALKDARAADRAKSYFLASMSHEIRTPLNAVIGFSELLNDRDLDVETRESYIAGISIAGHSLLMLINDILDLSKLEAGQMEYVPEKTDVQAYCREIETVFKGPAEKKNLRLSFCVRHLPSLFFDHQRVRQILFNLVGNAIKFTERGSVTVTFSFEKTTAEAGTLTLRVADTGIGIASEDRKKMFEPFVQLTRMRGTNASHNGTGLGLPIVAKMTRQMGGEIKVDSSSGAGSVFTITLPGVRFADDETSAAETTAAIENKENSASVSTPSVLSQVLVASGSPIDAKVFASLLRPFGLPFTTMSSGAEALRGLERSSASVLITALTLTDMSGVELAQHVRATGKTCRIIAVRASNEFVSLPVDLFDHILMKPISRSALAACLEGITK